MPKVNTILNYFTSPKNVKKPETKKGSAENSRTPKAEQKRKGLSRKKSFRKCVMKYVCLT